MGDLCHRSGEIIMNPYHYTQCGLDNIWLTNGYETHNTPYGKGISVQDVDGLHNSIAEALTEKPESLTGKEFRFFRIALEMSQKRIGGLVGKEAQTIANWEKSKELNQDADFLIRLIYRQTAINCHENYIEMVDHLNSLDRESFTTEFHRTETGWRKAS